MQELRSEVDDFISQIEKKRQLAICVILLILHKQRISSQKNQRKELVV